MPEVPATQEAEAGESLETRKKVEIAVSWDHATTLQPGWQCETLSQKKQNKTKQNGHDIIFSSLAKRKKQNI